MTGSSRRDRKAARKAIFEALPKITTADLEAAGIHVPMERWEMEEESLARARRNMTESKSCAVCGKPSVRHDWTFRIHPCADHSALLPSEFLAAVKKANSPGRND